eukprot:492374-Rhodomonas_salina.2
MWAEPFRVSYVLSLVSYVLSRACYLSAAEPRRLAVQEVHPGEGEGGAPSVACPRRRQPRLPALCLPGPRALSRDQCRL